MKKDDIVITILAFNAAVCTFAAILMVWLQANPIMMLATLVIYQLVLHSCLLYLFRSERTERREGED